MTRVHHHQKGSLIIAALLLFSLLLALGLGLMSSQSARMRAVRAQVETVQAKSLALSAWDDVRAKLGKDLFFPPITEGMEYFSYSEDVFDESDGGLVFVGTYTVIVDATYARLVPAEPDLIGEDSGMDIPVGFYQITCIGKVGERGANPRAERTMQFELDAHEFKVIRTHDFGSI